MRHIICVIMIQLIHLQNTISINMTKKKGTVLIIDDDEDVLITGKMILRSHYETIITETSPKAFASVITKSNPDVIILDMNYKTGATSGNEGLFFLREIKKLDSSIKVLMNTAYGDIQLAVECMKEGALDFIVKPWEKEKLITTVANAFKLREAERKVSQLESAQKLFVSDAEKDLGEMIGQSDAIKEVFSVIKKVAATDANILITGENGTGKELVARAIHKHSKRSDKPFIKADLGSLTESLFESELFGYKKGAFTDAKENRDGRFTIADEGTLFLDEIGNITSSQQSKLLTVLQNRQVLPIGDHKPIDIDIRLVSATNKFIGEAVDKGEFREDLLYRINTIEIELPPLRDRKGDIRLLSNHFIAQYAQKYEKYIEEIGGTVVTKLEAYDWPGNIRELQHAIERAVIMSSSSKLVIDDFALNQKKTIKSTGSLKVEDLELNAIKQAIEKHKGNLSKAAKEMGIGRSTLYRKMEKFGLS